MSFLDIKFTWNVNSNFPYRNMNIKESVHIWKPVSLAVVFTACLYVEDFPDNSVGEESTCNAGDPSSIPGSGKSSGEGIGYPFQYSWGSLVAQLGKESACIVGDLSSIPGLGRAPGEKKGYPVQYSGLENSMECIVHGVAKRHDWATFTFTLSV